MTLTFPWPASTASRKSYRNALRKAAFGEGYTQRSPDGLNAILRVWDAVFPDLSPETKKAIEDFLVDTDGTEPFFWAAPDETVVRKWVCEALPEATPQEDRIRWTLQAHFEEVP